MRKYVKQISIFKHFNISVFQGGVAGGGEGKTHAITEIWDIGVLSQFQPVKPFLAKNGCFWR